MNCYGRRKAIEAIKLLYDGGFEGALAVVDADFDRVNGKLEDHEGIIYSENHDFDLDWARPAVIQRYLAEVGDPSKCEACGTAVEIMGKILEGLKPVSVARLLNATRRINYKLAQIDISRCFCNFNINIEIYIDLIFESRNPTRKERIILKELIERMVRSKHDLYQITNGHDFHNALGVSLRDVLGSRRDPQSWGREVEMHFRLSFGDEDFKETLVYKGICMWVRDNRPYMILAARLIQ